MMPYISQKRMATSHDVIMKSVRKPVFVDNALHLGEISVASETTKTVTIRQRKKAHYAVASERAYEITELGDSVIIKHPQKDGRNSNQSITYLDDSSIAKPPLLFSKNNPTKRITISEIISDNFAGGTKFAIKNMKGESLLGIGFEDDVAHFGQIIDVGLRTTDLALRLSRDIADTLTSVNIALPMTPLNTEFDRRRHSNKFLSQDFYSINLISALRFVSRHDNRIVHFDRYGNLLYVPFDFEEGARTVNHNQRTGPATTKPIQNISNKVIIEGIPRSLNELSYAEVSSSEKQKDGDILEEPQAIKDFTVKTNLDARNVARSILKANSIMEGNKSSNGHPQSWDLRPGMVIEYEGVKRILTEVRHSLSKDEADLTFLSVDTGIEGVLQGVVGGTINTGNLPDNIQQIKEENIVLFGDMEIKSHVFTKITGHGRTGDGMIIGKAMGRGTIGATSSQETVGGSKGLTFIFKGGI